MPVGVSFIMKTLEDEWYVVKKINFYFLGYLAGSYNVLAILLDCSIMRDLLQVDKSEDYHGSLDLHASFSGCF